jgi:hypothetical protein
LQKLTVPVVTAEEFDTEAVSVTTVPITTELLGPIVNVVEVATGAAKSEGAVAATKTIIRNLFARNLISSNLVPSTYAFGSIVCDISLRW